MQIVCVTEPSKVECVAFIQFGIYLHNTWGICLTLQKPKKKHVWRIASSHMNDKSSLVNFKFIYTICDVILSSSQHKKIVLLRRLRDLYLYFCGIKEFIWNENPDSEWVKLFFRGLRRWIALPVKDSKVFRKLGNKQKNHFFLKAD